jgi:hypothetical protein
MTTETGSCCCAQAVINNKPESRINPFIIGLLALMDIENPKDEISVV